MTITIEIETVNQSYAVVQGLKERREWESEHNQEQMVDAIDDVLKQFEGTATGRALLSD